MLWMRSLYFLPAQSRAAGSNDHISSMFEQAERFEKNKWSGIFMYRYLPLIPPTMPRITHLTIGLSLMETIRNVNTTEYIHNIGQDWFVFHFRDMHDHCQSVLWSDKWICAFDKIPQFQRGIIIVLKLTISYYRRTRH